MHYFHKQCFTISAWDCGLLVLWYRRTPPSSGEEDKLKVKQKWFVCVPICRCVAGWVVVVWHPLSLSGTTTWLIFYWGLRGLLLRQVCYFFNSDYDTIQPALTHAVLILTTWNNMHLFTPAINKELKFVDIFNKIFSKYIYKSARQGTVQIAMPYTVQFCG